MLSSSFWKRMESLFEAVMDNLRSEMGLNRMLEMSVNRQNLDTT